MATIVSRHIACNRCRSRKVKCDGRRPWCRRCSGTGAELECFYETRGRSNSKPQQNSSYPPVNGSSLTPFTLHSDTDECDQSLTKSPPIELSDETALPSAIQDLKMAVAQLPSMDFSMSSGSDALSMDSSFDSYESVSSLGIDILDHTEVPLPVDAIISIDSIPFEHLSEMYHKYFMTTHQTFPFINQEVFASKLSAMPDSHEALALRFGMCAHGAAASPRFMDWAVMNLPFVGDQDYGNWFYRHSKFHLSKGEAESEGASSLSALQATALLGLYELRQSQFSQAWVTISRAVWIAQCIRHTKPEFLQPTRWRAPLPSPPPTPKGTLFATNEQNAMWAVLYLNCFLGIGMSSNVVDIVAQNEIGVYLPCHDELDTSIRLEEVMKTSRRAFNLSVKQHLSMATILCTRTMYHIKMMSHASSLDHNPYNFWTQHYHLDEVIRHLESCTSGSVHRATRNPEDVNCSMVVSILLKAIATCLHEALMYKAENEISLKGSFKHSTQAQSSHAVALQNCLDIAELVQAIVSAEEAKSSIFLPWSIYVAIQSLLRHQQRTTSSTFLTLTKSWSPNNSDNCAAVLGANCIRCGTASQSSCFDSDTAGLFTEAVVLDAINALRSSLTYLSHHLPLAQFFYDEAQVEAQGNEEQADRFVGLAAFMKYD